MRAKKMLLVPAAAMGLVVGVAAVPAAAQPRPPSRNRPPTRGRCGTGRRRSRGSARSRRPHVCRRTPRPIDPQKYELPDTMTWDDYRSVPGTSWADPSRKGSVRNFNVAVVLADYPNQPFEVTQPKNSSIFGNPTMVGDVPRDQVAKFYQDFLNKPQELNRGHTLHEYWMEDSGGRYGVNLTGFGAYRMPAKDHEYGVDGMQGGTGCPAATPATATCARTRGTRGSPTSARRRRASSTSCSSSVPGRTSRPPGRSSAR